MSVVCNNQQRKKHTVCSTLKCPTVKDRIDHSSDPHYWTLQRFPIQEEIQLYVVIADTLEGGREGKNKETL